MAVFPPLEHAARSVRHLLSGSPTGTPDWVGEMRLPGDHGLFGPGSMVWRVHAYPATLVGGVRALVLQALEPLSLAGVFEHSRFREDPIGRLRNTARFVTVVSYGSTKMVERECAMVRSIHERVRGTLPDGRSYAASDPLLLRHVHLSLVDSFLAAHQQFSPDPLTVTEADLYVTEMNALAPLLGFDTVELPTSTSELAAMLSPEAFGLEVSDQTRAALRFLAAPPLPLAQRPAYAVLFRAALASLPSDVRNRLPQTLPPLCPTVDLALGTALVRSLAALLGSSPAHDAARSRLHAGTLDPEG